MKCTIERSILLLTAVYAVDTAHLRGLSSNSNKVTAMKLITATTGAVIDLRQGAIIDLTDLGLTAPDFNIQAVGTDDVSTVKFNLESSYQRTEGTQPFTLCGDKGGRIFNRCDDLNLGEHTVAATPFDKSGVEGTALTIHFSLVDGPSNQEAVEVTGLQLVTVSTGRSIDLYDGGIIDLAELKIPEPDFTVQALTTESVASVQFELDSGGFTPLPPPPPPKLVSCRKQDFEGECTSKRQCQGKYSTAFDCKNSEGGVCFCGDNKVCGCIGDGSFTSNGTNTTTSTPKSTDPPTPTQEQTSGEVFIERDGLVVMEMESVLVVNPWKYEENVRGYTGSGYYRFDGNNIKTGPPSGTLSYKFRISNPGTYRMDLRSYKSEEDSTWANDCYTRLVGHSGYQGGTVKTYMWGPPFEWSWNTKHEYTEGNNQIKPIPYYTFKSAGVYELQISGRSKNFHLDRIVLYDEKKVSVNEARDLSQRESQRRSNIRNLELNYRRREGAAPFALCGNKGGNYMRCDELSLGTHTLTATPFDKDGVKGRPFSVGFSLIDSKSTPLETETEPSSIVSGELRKWHKVTLTFEGPTLSETGAPNPFLDYRLDVLFSHAKTGKAYNVPGYFAADGNAANSDATRGNIWMCHFAPDETGLWNFKAHFVTGDGVAVSQGGKSTTFDGKTGSFTISPTNKAGRDHRGKGRLEYVGEHHLRFAETGEYFLKAGPDSPENFLNYNDFSGTKGSKDWSPHRGDWKSGDPTWQGSKGKGIIGAVNYLSSVGANSFSFLSFSTQGDDPEVFPHISKSNFVRFDCSKLAQWEILFEHADSKGMYLHFKMGEQENDQLFDSRGDLGTERKLYYRELIARFGHHLALNWNLGEEISNSIAQIKSFSDYIKSIDPYQHPIVAHNGPTSVDNMFEKLLGHRSLDGPSIQSLPEPVFDTTLQWVKASARSNHKWVVNNDEQNPAAVGVMPDSADSDHDEIRHFALWGNIMAGGAGVEYYFGRRYSNNDLSLQDFRSRENMWKQSKICLDFFQNNNVPFYQMSNSNSYRVPRNSADWALENNKVIVIYRPSSGSSGKLDLRGLTGSWAVQWYDPRNGGSLKKGSTINSGGSAVSYGSPPNSSNKDWVLLITKS